MARAFARTWNSTSHFLHFLHSPPPILFALKAETPCSLAYFSLSPIPSPTSLSLIIPCLSIDSFRVSSPLCYRFLPSNSPARSISSHAPASGCFVEFSGERSTTERQLVTFCGNTVAGVSKFWNFFGGEFLPVRSRVTVSARLISRHKI